MLIKLIQAAEGERLLSRNGNKISCCFGIGNDTAPTAHRKPREGANNGAH